MKQIVSQEYKTIIFPSPSKEFNIQLRDRRERVRSLQAQIKTKGDIDAEPSASTTFFIYFSGFQGDFLLGEYDTLLLAQRAMLVISDYLSDMDWDIRDRKGELYYDGDILIMPDRYGMSQLCAFRDKVMGSTDCEVND